MTPLVAIIKDQVPSLTLKRVSAISICSGEDIEHNRKEEVLKGSYEIVYFTPEALMLSSQWTRMLSSPIYEEKLRALVIDEAHN